MEIINIEEIERICKENSIYGVVYYDKKCKEFGMPYYHHLVKLKKLGVVKRLPNFKPIRKELKAKGVIIPKKTEKKTFLLNVNECYNEIIEFIETNKIVHRTKYDKMRPKNFPCSYTVKNFKLNGIVIFEKYFSKNFYPVEELREVLRSENVRTEVSFIKLRPSLCKKYGRPIPGNWRKYYKVSGFKELMNLSTYELIVSNSLSHREITCHNFLEERGITFESEKVYPGLIGEKKSLRFDIYLTDKNILVELDGEFHDTNQAIITNDLKKDLFCKENRIELIRIKDLKDIIPTLKQIYPDEGIIYKREKGYDNLQDNCILNSKWTKACKIKLLLLKNGEVSKEYKKVLGVRQSQIYKCKIKLKNMGLLNKYFP